MFKMSTDEELFVYVELNENIDMDSFRNIHILGVDKENPIIQIDENFYVGKYELPFGTYMFFEDDPSPKSVDILFDKLPKKNLKYLCKTRKLLKMERTYVTPKEGTDSEIFPKIQNTDTDVEILNFKSVQEAIEKFKTECKNNPEKIKDNVEATCKTEQN